MGFSLDIATNGIFKINVSNAQVQKVIKIKAYKSNQKYQNFRLV